MPDVLTSDYIRQRYLAPDTLLNDFKPEPNQSGQAEIIRFLDTTQDAPVVKDLLQRYPDICEWPDFKVPHQHHCCVLSLLVESGLRHETAFPTIFAAITCEDKRALAVLARCQKDETDESIFRDLGWRRAVSSCSEGFLNFMTELEDPTDRLENNLKGLLDFCNSTFENGRFHKAYTIDSNWPESQQNKALARHYLETLDNPHVIATMCMMHEDIFEGYVLPQRYRRPAVLDTLAELGCPGVQFENHTCQSLTTS